MPSVSSEEVDDRGGERRIPGLARLGVGQQVDPRIEQRQLHESGSPTSQEKALSRALTRLASTRSAGSFARDSASPETWMVGHGSAENWVFAQPLQTVAGGAHQRFLQRAPRSSPREWSSAAFQGSPQADEVASATMARREAALQEIDPHGGGR